MEITLSNDPATPNTIIITSECPEGTPYHGDREEARALGRRGQRTLFGFLLFAHAQRSTKVIVTRKPFSTQWPLPIVANTSSHF